MLTPLGSGGRSRVRRRWPRVLAALLVLAVVVAGAWSAWRWLQHDDAIDATVVPTPVCRTPTLATPKVLPAPDGVTVAVANGTDRSGLAVATADALAARGFTVTDIGNTDRPVKKGTAQVRYAERDLDSAITVASYLPGATLVEVPKMAGADVAVWLGPEFGQVLPDDQADAASVLLPEQAPRCRTPHS